MVFLKNDHSNHKNFLASQPTKTEKESPINPLQNASSRVSHEGEFGGITENSSQNSSHHSDISTLCSPDQRG